MTLITGLFVLQEGKSVPFQEKSSLASFSMRTALTLAPQRPPPLFCGIGSLTVLELVDWVRLAGHELGGSCVCFPSSDIKILCHKA